MSDPTPAPKALTVSSVENSEPQQLKYEALSSSSSPFLFQNERPHLAIPRTSAMSSTPTFPQESTSCTSSFVPISSVQMSPSPPPPQLGVPVAAPIYQRQYSSSVIPVVGPTASSVTMLKPPLDPQYNTKMPLPLSSSTSNALNQGKSRRQSLTKTKPAAPQPDLAVLVSLDHNYCIPFARTPPAPVELPPPHAPPKKAVKVVREEPASRFKPVKYLLNRDENDESLLQPFPKTSPSKLEHLLKRTSMYDGPGGYLTSPRNKLYNYYREEESVDVDVVSLNPDPDLHCDLEKARVAMNECETHANFARPTEVDENWEDQIVKTGWTKIQRHLFNSVMKALHSEHFTRLAYQGNSAEVVLRRNSLDLTSQRVRKALVNVCWDGKLTQWLHGVLIDNLSHHYLAIYLDILQTLRSKAPALVDRMIVLSTVAPKSYPEPPASTPDKPPDPTTSKPQEGELAQIINAEAIHLLIKRQWDPFSSVIHQKGIKLKCNPVFLFVPAGPSWGHSVNIRRHKNFVNMLSNLGKVITVTMAPEISTCSHLSVDELAEKMILSSKMKLTETKSQLPDRPIYLVGWGTGSIIASTVSLTEQVAGVVCLGFPIFGISGRHGEGSDPLLQIKHPILFVIGDRATNCTISLLEEFREDLTNLQNSAYIVAIKSADEYLRVSRHHRNRLLVTQSYVDRCIVDEISLFVNDSYDAKSSVQTLTTPLTAINSVDYNSNGEPVSKQMLNVNGEPMEGLGLAIALSNGRDPDEEEAPKKNRRKSYHRKSVSLEDDLSLSDLSGGLSTSSRLSPPRKYRTKNVKLEPESSGDINDGTGRFGYEATNGGLAQQLQSFAHSSYPGMSAGFMSGGASGLFGAYPYFAGSEASHAYSAAYAHAANQAAAIQHAIAMETVEGYNQYYSQLQTYNSSSQFRQIDSTQSLKKPRKPRETKPKGEKPPRRSRQTKGEKASMGLNDRSPSHSSESTLSTGGHSSMGQGDTDERNTSRPSTLIQLLGQPREGLPATTTPGHSLTTSFPSPNTPLPAPSTTMAASALSSSPLVSYSQATSSLGSTSAFSSTQVFAVKSLPPNLAGSFESKVTTELSPTKTDSAPRSPPLLIPTQKSPNRIPIRLCLQTDPSGNGNNSNRESIAASLVPLPVDDPRDETSNLPPLVPARTQPKVVPSELKSGTVAVEGSKIRQRLRSGDLAKMSTVNEIAVENAKNLQVKLPRLSLPQMPAISSETRRPAALPSPVPVPLPSPVPVPVFEVSSSSKPSSSVAIRDVSSKPRSSVAPVDVSTKPSSSVRIPDVSSKPGSSVPIPDVSSKPSLSTSSADTPSTSKLGHVSKSKVTDLQGLSSAGKTPTTGRTWRDKFERNRKSKSQRDFDLTSDSDDGIPIPHFRARNESKKTVSPLIHSSSDEVIVPKKPKRPIEEESEVKKSKVTEPSKRAPDLEAGPARPSTSTKRTKRTIRAAKIIGDRIDSSDEEIESIVKKNVRKRNSNIDSSSSSSDSTSKNSRKGKKKRFSKVETSDDEIIPKKKGRGISRIDSSDEEVEPKILRSRSQGVRSNSGDETKRAKRLPKRQSYREEIILTSSEEEDEEERRPIKKVGRKISVDTRKPAVEKRKTRQSSGGDSKRGTTEIRFPSKSATDERRLTRGSEGKGRRPVPDIEYSEIVDSEATTDEEEDDSWRVTRSGSHTSKRPSRGESHQKSREDNQGDSEEDEEDGNGQESRKRRSIFPVTPASLAATRTRKVSIPKFFAYGM